MATVAVATPTPTPTVTSTPQPTNDYLDDPATTSLALYTGGAGPSATGALVPKVPSTLPAEFADLEPFADWCLATEAERYAKAFAPDGR